MGIETAAYPQMPTDRLDLRRTNSGATSLAVNFCRIGHWSLVGRLAEARLVFRHPNSRLVLGGDLLTATGEASNVSAPSGIFRTALAMAYFLSTPRASDSAYFRYEAIKIDVWRKLSTFSRSKLNSAPNALSLQHPGTTMSILEGRPTHAATHCSAHWSSGRQSYPASLFLAL